MNIVEEYFYKKGKLAVIEKLKGDTFTPCSQSGKLKHYLDSQTILKI
jgi:hypothetical protein